MSITINGNGTVTGISVGGLPDGIVDTDMIANNAVTTAKSTITGGKILQVVQNTTTTRTATSSNSFIATADLVTITPTAASSKILVNFTGQANTNGTNRGVYVTIYRSINSGTFTNIAPQGSNQTFGASTNHGFTGNIRGSDSRIQVPLHINYLDSPSYSVGNSIVYKLYVRSLNSDEIEIPASDNAEPIICMATEVAA